MGLWNRPLQVSYNQGIVLAKPFYLQQFQFFPWLCTNKIGRIIIAPDLLFFQ